MAHGSRPLLKNSQYKDYSKFNPDTMSFYQFACRNLSDATLEKLAAWSVDEETNGEEICGLFQKIIMYTKGMQIRDLKRTRQSSPMPGGSTATVDLPATSSPASLATSANDELPNPPKKARRSDSTPDDIMEQTPLVLPSRPPVTKIQRTPMTQSSPIEAASPPLAAEQTSALDKATLLAREWQERVIAIEGREFHTPSLSLAPAHAPVEPKPEPDAVPVGQEAAPAPDPVGPTPILAPTPPASQYATYSSPLEQTLLAGLCAFCQSSDHISKNCTVCRTWEQRQAQRSILNLCVHCLLPYNYFSCRVLSHKKQCTTCGFHATHEAFCRRNCLPLLTLPQ